MNGTPAGARRSGLPTTRPTDLQTVPATSRQIPGSTTMFGQMHEELARQRHREAQLEARGIRLRRAVRAERRARRAVEVAVRAAERAEPGRLESHRLRVAGAEG